MKTQGVSGPIVSAQAELSTDLGQDEQTRTDEETLENNELVESLLESEFYAKWEDRQYGEPMRPVGESQRTSPNSSSKAPAPNLRAHSAPPMPRALSVRRLMPPRLIGTQVAAQARPTLPSASAAAKHDTSERASERKESGTFIREAAVPRASSIPPLRAPVAQTVSPHDAWLRPQRTTVAVPPPPPPPRVITNRDREGRPAASDRDVLARERALLAELQEALRKMSASEASRIEAEQRVRTAGQRASRAELELARSILHHQEIGETPEARPASHSVLWISLSTTLLTLAASYGAIYLPIQARMDEQHMLLRRSLEQNQRDFATLYSLLEQERRRSAREYEQLSAPLSQLLTHPTAALSESPARRLRTAPPPGPEAKPTRVKRSRWLLRQNAQQSEISNERSDDVAPSDEPPSRASRTPRGLRLLTKTNSAPLCGSSPRCCSGQRVERTTHILRLWTYEDSNGRWDHGRRSTASRTLRSALSSKSLGTRTTYREPTTSSRRASLDATDTRIASCTSTNRIGCAASRRASFARLAGFAAGAWSFFSRHFQNDNDAALSPTSLANSRAVRPLSFQR
jgi:hypothetical protein